MLQFNPFFQVSRQPAFAEINGNRIELGKDALFNAETNQVVGLVSPNYTLATNFEVASLISEVLGTFKILSLKDHLSADTGKWVRSIVLDDDRFTMAIKGSDILKTKIDIMNGYDGRTAASFNVSAVRLICTNGMVAKKKDLFGESFTHSGDVVSKLLERLMFHTEQFQGNVGTWTEWAEVPFTENDFANFIQSRNYLSEKQKEALKGFFPEVLNQYGDDETKWGAFNVLTAVATHNTTARKGSHIFGTAFKRMEKLAADFYSYEPGNEIVLAA